MKIRKSYALFINPMLNTATYGNGKFSRRINYASLGTVYDCNLAELKQNLNKLKEQGYHIRQSKY